MNLHKTLILIILPFFGFSQIGGVRSYEFMNLPSNASIAALGGVMVSQPVQNSNAWLSNPSILDSATIGAVSLGYMGYFAGINLTNVSYAIRHKKVGNIGMGVQFLNYGAFEAYDPAGNSVGTFDANEFAISIGTARQVGVFMVGANLKLAGSRIDMFSSTAILADIGGIFYPTESGRLSVGMVFKNIGFILNDYSASSDSALPFDVQLGITYKPEYMPVRFTLSGYNLVRDDVVYFDQRLNNQEDEPSATEQLFRRMTFGTELLLSDNFHLQLGYNHLTRKELRQTQISGGAGFSYGFLVTVKRVTLNYARAFYHIAGASNFISLNTNINYFKKNKI